MLRVGAFPVGADSEEYGPGWFPFSILDSGSSTENFTLVDGVLSQDKGVVMRYYREDYSLPPKRLYVTKSQEERQPVRWKVSGDGVGRTLGYLDGEGGKVSISVPKRGNF